MWSVTQQIYTTDDPTSSKLTGLGSSVGRESAPRISFIVSLLDEAVKCGQKPTELPRPVNLPCLVGSSVVLYTLRLSSWSDHTILQMIPPNMVS